MNKDVMKLFKQACKIMTEEQKNKVKGFREWKKAQKKSWALNKIYSLLKDAKRKKTITDIVVSFKKDDQKLASECLREMISNQLIHIDAKWNCLLNKEKL